MIYRRRHEVFDNPAPDPAHEVAPPRSFKRRGGDQNDKKNNIPAQVCEFLVDSLQSHFEVCIMVWRVLCSMKGCRVC